MKKKLCLAVILAALALIAIAVVKENAQEIPVAYTYESYHISSNDTIWDLAQGRKAGSMTTKDYVDEVGRLNNINPDKITSGNYVVLPVYK